MIWIKEEDISIDNCIYFETAAEDNNNNKDGGSDDDDDNYDDDDDDNDGSTPLLYCVELDDEHNGDDGYDDYDDDDDDTPFGTSVLLLLVTLHQIKVQQRITGKSDNSYNANFVSYKPKMLLSLPIYIYIYIYIYVSFYSTAASITTSSAGQHATKFTATVLLLPIQHVLLPNQLLQLPPNILLPLLPIQHTLLLNQLLQGPPNPLLLLLPI